MKLKMKIVIPIIIIFLGVTAYFGVLEYKKQQFVKEISSLVKNSSLRIDNIIATELSPDSISYREHINNIESNVSEIEKNIFTVQTISNETTAEISDPTIDYLRACIKTHRALSKLNRLNIKKNILLKTMKEQTADLQTQNQIMLEAAIKVGRKTIEEIKVFEKEWTAFGIELHSQFSDLITKQQNISQFYPKHVLANTEEIEKIKNKFSVFVKKGEDSSSSITESAPNSTGNNTN